MSARTVQAGMVPQQGPGREQEPTKRHECKGDVTAGTSEIRKDKLGAREREHR